MESSLENSLEISAAGTRLLLLPQRALYWPAQHILFIADIHFGKAAAFRAAGIPVPHGTTSQNLAALDGLLATHDVREIVFLGDFLHARAAHAPATLAALRGWRAAHPALRLTLVRGNHDLHAGDPPAELGIAAIDEASVYDPFVLRHHPEASSFGFVLAGHVHPVIRLARGRESLRLPCFVLAPGLCILPSFGAFTGGYEMAPAPDTRYFAAAGDTVQEVPAAGLSGIRRQAYR